MRDIEDYSKKYIIPGFEKYKVIYRRRQLLEVIERYKPEKVLEIGCGKEPLFLYASDIHFTVVEPSDDFYENLRRKLNIIQRCTNLMLTC